MNTDPVSEGNAQDGVEAVNGAAGVTRQRAASAHPAREPLPPYAGPYPPYLTSDVPYTGGLSVAVASGLAYFTVMPAIFFLLLEPYRSNPVIRFHSWQSIFYFLVLAAVRVMEMLLVSMLPAEVAFTISGLLSLALFAGWLMATIKAFQGSKLCLFFIGEYAEQTARTAGGR